MDELLQLKVVLESEKGNLEFLIEKGNSKFKNLREELLEINGRELSAVKEKIDKLCIHKWIEDEVELGFSGMKKIIYCNNCGLCKI